MTIARRGGHLLVAVVAVVALVLQLVLVVQGHGVLDETDPPGLAARLVRLVSYFTVLSNVMVAITSARSALGLDRPDEHRVWRVLRLDALVGIAVTGAVHLLLLRGLLDLDGADLVADTLLHRVVPPLFVVVWLLAGPRGRLEVRDVAWATAYPVVYEVWTYVHGRATGFWPYPFTDVDELGLPRALVNGLAVLVLFAALAAVARALDRRLPR
jgi:hypothetical protein